MNYAEMSDFEINKAVAAACPGEWYDNGTCVIKCDDDDRSIFQPCKSWADAGPIIAANKISLDFDADGYEPPQNAWCKASSPCGQVYYGGESEPIRAAMIVFLMMQEKPNA